MGSKKRLTQSRKDAKNTIELAKPCLLGFADLLWRMGEAEGARTQYDAARSGASGIADPALRKRVLASIDQGLQVVSDLPPIRISATPDPRVKSRLPELIAGAESRNGMKEEGKTTFQDAIALSQKLATRPRPVPGVRRPPVPLGTHYEDEAFERIVRQPEQSKTPARG